MSFLGSITSQCGRDLGYWAKSTKSKWALEMIDAFGKPRSGFLKGALLWLGHYSECKNAIAPQLHGKSPGFKGKYCLVELEIETNVLTMPMVSGICVPSSCTEDDVNKSISTYSRHFSNPIKQWLQFDTRKFFKASMINCDNESFPFTSFDYIVGFLLLFLVCLISIGSYIEWSRRRKKSKYEYVISRSDICINMDDDNYDQETFYTVIEDVLECFSLKLNYDSVIKTSSDHLELKCFHGIRVLCMLWVLLGHSLAFFVTVIVNPLDEYQVIMKWYGGLFRHAMYSVDTFFFMSGFLVAFHFFDMSSKICFGKREWLVFYLHRYIRLTIPVFTLFALNQTFWFRMSEGPFFETVLYTRTYCSTYWWYNFLYINNLLDNGIHCNGWLWYLANEWQFYALSPFILIGLKRQPRKTFIIVGILTTLSVVVTFRASYQIGLQSTDYYFKEFYVNIADTISKLKRMYLDIYIKPYCRAGPYLIGLCCGYIHFAGIGKRVVIAKGKLTIGWAICILFIFSCLASKYTKNESLILGSMYNAGFRIVWALACAWVIYACVNGYGGFVNGFFSMSYWIPLSRISFLVYLFHPLVLMSILFSTQIQTYFSITSFLFYFIAVTGFSFSAAFVLNILIESPLLKIEKYLRDRYMGPKK